MSKVPCIRWILNPETQISIRFTLRPAIFEIQACRKLECIEWPQNDFKHWSDKSTLCKLNTFFSNPHRLAIIASQNIISYLLPLGPNYKKIASAPNDLKMILNAKKPKVPYICWSTPHESQISLRFAVRSLVFQIIDVFDFSIGYNGEFKILEKNP